MLIFIHNIYIYIDTYIYMQTCIHNYFKSPGRFHHRWNEPQPGPSANRAQDHGVAQLAGFLATGHIHTYIYIYENKYNHINMYVYMIYVYIYIYMCAPSPVPYVYVNIYLQI